MSNKPTKNSIVGQFKNNTGLDDFIQFYEPTGTIVAWIDANGFLMPQGSGGGGTNLIPSTTLYVDQTRTDSYTPNGTIQYPFKSIMAAVNQIVANGDNSTTKPYAIDIVGPGTYAETVNLSNPALVDISLEGHSNVLITPTDAFSNAVQAIGNPGLQTLTISNLSINVPSSGTYKAVELTDAANTGTFLGGGLAFINCFINTTSPDGVHLQNVVKGKFLLCHMGTPTSVTIDNNYGNNIAFLFCTIEVGGTLTIKNAGFVNDLYSRLKFSTITIDSASTLLSDPDGQIGTPGGTVTVNGTFIARDSQVLANVTVSSTGSFVTQGIHYEGSLTINSGGLYTQSGTYAASAVNLGGSNISSGTGSPNSAVTGNPGDLYLNQSGGSGTTLYVKESGTGTNTGWVGK